MGSEGKTLLIIGAATAVLIVVLAFFASSSTSNQSNSDRLQSGKLMNEASHQTGPKEAKVTLIEFGDFQCPACEQAYPTVTKIEKDYEGKIVFVFRNFPLPQHNNAQAAAESAEAAGAQGKYWEMYNKLYGLQSEWATLSDPTDKFVSYAKDLNLDTNKFKQEISENKYSSVINKDQADGESLGVNSTPTFFINGEKITGVASYDTFKNKIDYYLNK